MSIDKPDENDPVQLLVVTRVHMNSASAMPDPLRVLKFIQNSIVYADGILICVGAKDMNIVSTYISTIENILLNNKIDVLKISFLPIFPWGYFTPALNYAVQYAQDRKFNRIAFQSLEVQISIKEVQCVLDRLNMKNTIVVGPVLSGHDFIQNSGNATATSSLSSLQPLTGRTCPWNTFAIWRVHELGFIGFPLIADGSAEDRSIGGVEEVMAITMLQKINSTYTAVLLNIQSLKTTDTDNPNIVAASMIANRDTPETVVASWDTNFVDPQRQQYHNEKMASKIHRPAAQLRVLGIDAGTVLHETIEC